MRSSPPLVAALALVLTSSAPAAQVGAPVPQRSSTSPATALRSARFTFVVEQPDGRSRLFVAPEVGSPAPFLRRLAFLPIELAGHARKDRVRLDRPGQVLGAEPARVRLAGGGSIHRVAARGRTALVLVGVGTRPRVLATRTDTTAGAGLASWIHVSPDGERGCVATPLEAGGNLLVFDLVGEEPVLVTTAASPPLDIDPTSVRVGAGSAWFVADGVLYADLLDDAQPPRPVLLSSDPVLPELALADRADQVLALVQRGDGKRRVHLVSGDGAWSPVTKDYQEYSQPNYGHPLGPWLVISHDAEFAGIREAEHDDQDLHFRDLRAAVQQQLVTTDPDFPGYVDNIGVLAFGAPNVLCFFGGDQKLSGISFDEEVGAADMYAATIDPDGSFALGNITRTNGLTGVPFSDPATLRFSEALVGAKGDRIHLFGADPITGVMNMVSFDVLGGDGTSRNAEPLLPLVGGVPHALGTPHGTLLLSSEVEPVSYSLVSCAGDTCSESVVHLLATDDPDPFATGAKIVFDGLVARGDTFDLDAAVLGGSKLEAVTFVHAFRTDGTLLQSVEVRTDCTTPFALGEHLGAYSLVDYVGENGSPFSSFPLCQGGANPVTLTFEYTGEGCAASASSQPASKTSCAGDPAFAPLVQVLATDKEDPADTSAKVWFAGSVALGDRLQLDAENAGEDDLKDTTFVHLFDAGGTLLQSVKLTTSCSEPLVVGEQFGSLKLLDGRVKGKLGGLCASGPPAVLTLRYTGSSCAPVPLPPRVHLVDRDVVALREIGGAGFPPGTVLDRATLDPRGDRAAFVARRPAGPAEVYLVDLVAGSMEQVFVCPQVSPTLVFDARGVLVFGAGSAGSWELVELVSAGVHSSTPTAGACAPLAH